MESEEGPTDAKTERGYRVPPVLQRANEPFKSLTALHHQKVMSPETCIDRRSGRAFYGNFVLLAFERVETQEEGSGGTQEQLMEQSSYSTRWNGGRTRETGRKREIEGAWGR